MLKCPNYTEEAVTKPVPSLGKMQTETIFMLLVFTTEMSENFKYYYFFKLSIYESSI